LFLPLFPSNTETLLNQTKINKAFILLTIALFAVALIPALIRDGMFLDGVTYAAISKNMAHGIGSYFEPHYTKTLYPAFHEHPPLALIMQSFFFRFLGDSFLTERIYCLIMALLAAYGIILCWRLMATDIAQRNKFWISLLIWLMVPIVSWSYTNNLIENTLSVFTVFSTYFILKALIKRKFIFLIAGSFFIVAAFLCKGFTGTFPLVIPLIYALVFKSRRISLLYFLSILLMTIGIFIMAMILFPLLKDNLLAYVYTQVIPALNNHKEITVNYRLEILSDLLQQLYVPIILALFIFFRNRIIAKAFTIKTNKNFFVFLILALSASIPLIISLKQRQFYLVPSIPFFALAFGFLFTVNFEKIWSKISRQWLFGIKTISILTIIVILAFAIFNFGKFSRNKDELPDIYTTTAKIPYGTIISTTKNTWEDWQLAAYFCRINYISLDCDHDLHYYFVEKNELKNVPEGYTIIDLHLKKYYLLQKEK
jgi:4-amino-4-deoxy-L-arabinose transferase-like glycosyltransferase